MLSSKEFQSRLPLYSSGCEVSLGNFLPYINPEEALAVMSPCSGRDISFVDCKSSHRENFIEEIDGLDFGSVKMTTKHDFELPQYIPVVCAEFFECAPDSVPSEIIGVSLKDVRSYFLKGGIKLLGLPIFEGKKVVLFMSGRDDLIERVWQQSDRSKIFEKIGGAGFFAITAINFSVFFGECPFGHAINLKKSLKALELVEHAGGRIIPHLYWANKYHLERWVKWLNDNPSVKYITINCQAYKGRDYQLINDGISYIRDNTKNRLNFILEGPKNLRHLIAGQPADNFIVAYKGPSYNARNYRQYFSTASGKLGLSPAGMADRSKLLPQNINVHASYIRGIFQNQRRDLFRGDIIKNNVVRHYQRSKAEQLINQIK